MNSLGNFDRSELPIGDSEEEIKKAIKENNYVIVTAETGSGKTVLVPFWLHQMGDIGC